MANRPASHFAELGPEKRFLKKWALIIFLSREALVSPSDTSWNACLSSTTLSIFCVTAIIRGLWSAVHDIQDELFKNPCHRFVVPMVMNRIVIWQKSFFEAEYSVPLRPRCSRFHVAVAGWSTRKPNQPPRPADRATYYTQRKKTFVRYTWLSSQRNAFF